MLTVSSLTVPTCAVPHPSLSANCREFGKIISLSPGLMRLLREGSVSISLVAGQHGMQALSLCCKLVLLEHKGVGASSESLQWCPQVTTCRVGHDETHFGFSSWIASCSYNAKIKYNSVR